MVSHPGPGRLKQCGQLEEERRCFRRKRGRWGGGGGDAGHWEPAAKYDEDTGHWTLWTRKHAAVAKYNWCHLQLVPGIGGVIAVPRHTGTTGDWAAGESGVATVAVSLRRCVRMCGHSFCVCCPQLIRIVTTTSPQHPPPTSRLGIENYFL